MKYMGRTRNRANLTDSGYCKSPNGKSVLDFGPLPVAGRACAWYIIQDGRDSVAEADIRLKRRERWTLKPDAARCSNRLDLQGVATHELGHAFGLAHVTDAHKNLTMTERLALCMSNARTLGKGDVRGLKGIY
jgi:hypothetical protein